ncbi:hypothetical protein KUTeg_007125 [Tegillarca granosa]|uniref:Matrin-type domain-containing protein n=1 Tax=Tegillarca granosa TaxID=220873 RepID=A0ABQ9FCC1_TEGGR|nr:hypothetical protein KUTeg_007125 [Tegillarca granosa]
METLLEQQRRYHEERERITDAMTKEMLQPSKMGREQINSDHRLKQLLDRYMECSTELKDLYEDKDGLRKEEIQALSGPNEFAEFYTRLKQLREFHRKHPNEISIPMSVEFEELAKVRENPADENLNMVDFTDEEGYGKYLDLHSCFERFVNLKGMEEMEIVKTDFESQWTDGSFPGWPKEATGALAHTGAHLDLSAFSSSEELASLGLDRLKSALMALGLKCGGTLEERAIRLFSTKGKNLDDLDPNMFAKSKPGRAGKSRDTERQKEIAAYEAQVYRFAEILGEQRAATKENVQRKQARTGEEREESDDEHFDESDSDEDDDDIPYNPKNLPLGWDGKPIPYWLYKLHGLNISYTCEICGNYTYRGPKAFQRHFAEWRHAHGMRCLGIPNTAHFANVTLIEDALALWLKIKSVKETDRWRPETEEEYEDTSGNVFNKKTYEDLKRQGLL